MTIDVKKIILKLSMSLEKLEKLKKKRKLGQLINIFYMNIIRAVGEFIYCATCKLKNKTTEDIWEECEIKMSICDNISEDMWRWKIKRGVWNNYYVSYSEESEPLILLRAVFKDKL